MPLIRKHRCPQCRRQLHQAGYKAEGVSGWFHLRCIKEYFRLNKTTAQPPIKEAP